MTYVTLMTQWVIGTVFVISSVTKVRNQSSLRSFTSTATQLTGLRGRSAKVLALTVILAEAAIPILLSRRGFCASSALALAATLLAAFSLALTRAIRRGDSGPCHCFGSTGTLSWIDVYRNLLLMAVSVIGYWGTSYEQHIGPNAILVTGMIGTFIGTIIAATDDLRYLLPSQQSDSSSGSTTALTAGIAGTRR